MQLNWVMMTGWTTSAIGGGWITSSQSHLLPPTPCCKPFSSRAVRGSARPPRPFAIYRVKLLGPMTSSPIVSTTRFKGVRQRPRGKWVADIHKPIREAWLWLGIYDTGDGLPTLLHPSFLRSRRAYLPQCCPRSIAELFKEQELLLQFVLGSDMFILGDRSELLSKQVILRS